MEAFKLAAFTSVLLGQTTLAGDSCSVNATVDASGNAQFSSFGKWGPNGVVYNEDEAFEALMLAYGAYATKQSLTDWTCGCCGRTESLTSMTITHVYDAYSNQAYCGHFTNGQGKKTIALVFRGTYNACGWICNDFDADLVEYPGVDGGKIYEGFWRVWQNEEDGNDSSYYGYKDVFVPKIMEMLDEFCLNNEENDGCELLITGHSLGAALAQVSSLTFADLLRDNSEKWNVEMKVFSYGSPRWANRQLSKVYDDHESISTRWRLVNGYDVVTMMPPVLMKFWHATTQVYYEHGLSEAAVGN